MEQTKRLLQAKQNLDVEGHQLQSLREFVCHKWSVKETSHLLSVLDDIGDLIDMSGNTGKSKRGEICDIVSAHSLETLTKKKALQDLTP